MWMSFMGAFQVFWNIYTFLDLNWNRNLFVIIRQIFNSYVCVCCFISCKTRRKSFRKMSNNAFVEILYFQSI